MNGSYVGLTFTLGMNRDAFALDLHNPAKILLTVHPEPKGQAALDDARILTTLLSRSPMTILPPTPA